jgi:hypothetical protein
MVETETKIVKGTSLVEQALTTKTNLYRATWNKIFREIKSNLVDPKSRGENFIFGSYPDWHIGDNEVSDEELKSKYPLVIIENPTMTDNEAITCDYETSIGSINIVFDIFSERNDYLDKLTDEIQFILLNNIQTNAQTGLHNMSIINDSYTHYLRSGLKMHNRTFTVRFDIYRG